MILLDPERSRLLPTPLAAAAALLERETRISGVHTTADELVGCIEAFFGFLGRLWVAEYLAAGAPDAAANVQLYSTLVSARQPVLGGAWIGLARLVRGVFVDRGLEPVAVGLRDYDFGRFGEHDDPVARLSAYRNSFAHGSFHAVVDEIVAHRELLDAEIARLPFLIDQPVVVDTGGEVVALRGTATVIARPAVPIEPLHPSLIGPDGRVVDLHPLATGRDEEGQLGLAWSVASKKSRGISPQDIARHVRFAAWLDRYQRELDGDVEAASSSLGEPVDWPEAARDLEARVAELDRAGRCLVLVESPPGAPRAGLLASWAGTDALRWRVDPRGLMGSGLVLARAISRHAERVLGLDRGAIGANDGDDWRATLGEVARRCVAAGVRLRFAMDDLHLGEAAARPGEPSVHEVWRALSTGPWTVVGGATRAWSIRPLPWDARVQLGFGAAPSTEAIRAFLAARTPTAAHRGVLRTLANADAPVDVFDVCDTLDGERADTTAQPVFEPEIERALWDLAPVLAIGREARSHDGVTEPVRTFALANPVIVTVAREVLA